MMACLVSLLCFVAFWTMVGLLCWGCSKSGQLHEADERLRMEAKIKDDLLKEVAELRENQVELRHLRDQIANIKKALNQEAKL